jgi:hypothetical protein
VGRSPTQPVWLYALAAGLLGMDLDLQALASNFNTMTLQPPQQNEWYFDFDATTNMTSDAGILTLHMILFLHPWLLETDILLLSLL